MNFYENDNELLYMIHQEDEWALRMIIEKYRKVIDCKIAEIVYDKSLYRQYKEDLRQVGLILLQECIASYNAVKNTKFSTFFSFCLERKIRSQVKSYHGQGGMYLTALSLDQTVDEFGEFTLGENIESRYPDYQSDALIKFNSVVEGIEKVTDEFNGVERAICRLKQQGYTYPEIVAELSCNYKKVDNTMQKFRKALNGYLKTNYY